MKLHYKKIINNKKMGRILPLLIFILIFMLVLYQYNTWNTTSYPNGLLSKDSDSQICYRGENTIITVRMLNSTDPIIGELTLFYDQTNGLLIGGEYTNSSGYAVLNWSIPPDYPLGLTNISASCPNRPDAIPVYVDLLIKSKTFCENLTYPVSAYPEEYLVVEVDLRDNNNDSISNQQINLYDYQNTSLAASITNESGHCTLSWEIPFDIVPGLYRFEIKFEGNQLYSPAENEFNVTILTTSIEIISINLNTTRVKPNMPILVTVEITDDNPLITVKINETQLEKTDGTIWQGTIISPSVPGKYLLNVVAYFNETQYTNDSSTYFIVEGEALDFSAGTFLLFFNNSDDSLTRELTVLTPISAMAIISAVVAWKKRNRQPSFSRDYTLEVGSDSS